MVRMRRWAAMEVTADAVVASDWHDRVRLLTFGRLAAGGFWTRLGVS